MGRLSNALDDLLTLAWYTGSAYKGSVMPKDDYRSYVLRLWKAQRQGRSLWQAELQDVHTGKRHSFTLEGLLSFLQAHYSLGDEQSPDRHQERDQGI
jgi:hypothetical protein